MGAREILAGRAAVEVSVLDKTAAGFAAAEAKLKAFSRAVGAIGRGMTRVGREIALIGAASFAPLALSFRELYDAADKGLLNPRDFELAVDLFASLQNLRNAIRDLATEVALALAPALSATAKILVPIISALARFAEHNQALTVAFALGAAAVTTFGLTLMAFGSILGAVSAGIGGIVAAVATVGAPVLLIAAAVGAVVAALTAATAAFFLFTEVGQRIAAGFAEFMRGIVDAVANGDFRSAWEQVLKGIEVEWLAHILVIKQAFWGLAQFVADVLAGMLRGVSGVLAEAEGLTGLNFGSGTVNSAAGAVSAGAAGMASGSIGATRAALEQAKSLLAMERQYQAGQREQAYSRMRAGMDAAAGVTAGPTRGGAQGTFNPFGAALLGRAGESAETRELKNIGAKEDKTNKLLEAIKERLGGLEPEFAFE